jgi:hypothetical protein
MSKVESRTRLSAELPLNTPNPGCAAKLVAAVPVAQNAVEAVEDAFHPPGPMPVKLGAFPTKDGDDLEDRVSVKVVCWLTVMVVWPTTVVVSSELEGVTMLGTV